MIIRGTRLCIAQHRNYTEADTKPACEGGELKYCIKFCSTCYSPVPGEPEPGCTTPTIATLGGVSGPWTIKVTNINDEVGSLFQDEITPNINQQYTCARTSRLHTIYAYFLQLHLWSIQVWLREKSFSCSLISIYAGLFFLVNLQQIFDLVLFFFYIF